MTILDGSDNNSHELLKDVEQKTKNAPKSQNQSRRRHRCTSSKRRRKKSSESNIFASVKSEAKNDDELDVIRNVHKLGIETKPIPFSYKSG